RRHGYGQARRRERARRSWRARRCGRARRRQPWRRPTSRSRTFWRRSLRSRPRCRRRRVRPERARGRRRRPAQPVRSRTADRPRAPGTGGGIRRRDLGHGRRLRSDATARGRQPRGPRHGTPPHHAPAVRVPGVRGDRHDVPRWPSMTRPPCRARLLVALVTLTLLAACTSELDTLGEPLRIVGATLPNAVLREPYEQPIHVVGGLRPYDVQLETGELPPGLTLQSGVIRGSPEEIGDFAFTLKASDANLAQVVQEYALRVTSAPPTTLRFEAPQTEVRTPVTLRATVRDARALTGLRTLVQWDAAAFRLREGSVTATRGGLALVSQPGEGTLQVDLVALGDTLDGKRELFRFVLEPIDP